MSRPELKDKVVVIVDASSELGQACALLFATEGTRLVLNYPPTAKVYRPRKNDVPHASPLSALKGNHGRVAITHEHMYDADKVVETAISRFNSIHVLINNTTLQHAIDSDTFERDDAWNVMRQAILKGAFRALKAAWPHFRQQKSGCAIQAACSGFWTGPAESSASFALIGLIQTLAKEGAKYNISAHFVTLKATAVMTGSREVSVRSTMILQLSSLIIALSRQSSSKISGTIFECHAEGVSRLQWQRSSGILLNPDINFTVSALLGEWSGIDDFSDSMYPTEAVDFAELLPKAQAVSKKLQAGVTNFDGKVVIVTGAGSGLGRSYALAFAEAGASVVVNDRADPKKVVDEIRLRGGKAISCIASVQSGEFIVRTAMNAYGRVDVLINNAGFLRDKAFINMDEATWDVVLDVHLDGTYQMTKALWPHFVKQGYGRIVNTSSTSGIYGHFGQANYSAAKLGILGLSDATARLGLQHNIHVNTIAPVASTAALNQSMSADNKNNQTVFKPDYVAPMVLALSMDRFPVGEHPTGNLFELGCGWHARSRLLPSSTYEDPFSQQGTEKTLLASTETTIAHREEHYESSSGSNPKTGLGVESSCAVMRTDYAYSDRDVILYNLAVGAKSTDLRLVFEGAEKFQAIPTFGLIPFFSPSVISQNAELVPNFEPTLSLLGEHYLEILQYPIPTSGSFSSTRTMVDVIDKETAAVSITGYSTVDMKSGAKLFYNEVTFFMRGSGGFGGSKQPRDRGRAGRTYTVPSTPPDNAVEYQTSEEQAALYRLTGDRMAIHIDPEFSRRGGFDIPILHGACFMGIAGKQIFDNYGAYRSIKVRFTGVVLPGQTLRTEMWKDKTEHGLVLFQMRVLETGKLCIAGGGAHLWEESSLARL